MVDPDETPCRIAVRYCWHVAVSLRTGAAEGSAKARLYAAAGPEPWPDGGDSRDFVGQRVVDVIDATPLPESIKAAAARVTRRTATEGNGDKTGAGAPDYIGTPGVESAGGRDRTAPGGDLPPDLATP